MTSYGKIQTIREYLSYCDILEGLVSKQPRTKKQKHEINLLTRRIEEWDKKRNTFKDIDSIESI